MIRQLWFFWMRNFMTDGSRRNLVIWEPLFHTVKTCFLPLHVILIMRCWSMWTLTWERWLLLKAGSGENWRLPLLCFTDTYLGLSCSYFWFCETLFWNFYIFFPCELRLKNNWSSSFLIKCTFPHWRWIFDKQSVFRLVF